VTQSQAEDEAFAAYGRELMVWIYPRLGLLVAGALALWWPLDLLVLPAADVRATYAELRPLHIGLTLALSALIAWLPLARRRPAVFCVAAVAGLSALTAHYMALSGPLGGPWFHFLYGCPMLSIPLVVRPAWRTVGALLIAAAAWGAYVATAPGELHHPLHPACVSFLAFATAMSVVLGHFFYRIVHSNFLHRTRLGDEQEELRRLNERLGTLIDERTVELRRLTQHIDRVREEERRWIAHEIHDELGQELAGLRLGLAVSREAARETAPGCRAQLDELSVGFDRVAETMRRILRGLRPAVLDELGAVEAIRWLAHETSDRAGLKVEVQVSPPDLELVRERGTTVFRIVQEALTNVVRHARAKRATVSLAARGGALELTVSDDGVGFAEPTPGRGLGLVSIRERAKALAGEATWARRRNGGTRLTVKLPATDV
jgi:signal transduction histidine kinase